MNLATEFAVGLVLATIASWGFAAFCVYAARHPEANSATKGLFQFGVFCSVVATAITNVVPDPGAPAPAVRLRAAQRRAMASPEFHLRLFAFALVVATIAIWIITLSTPWFQRIAIASN